MHINKVWTTETGNPLAYEWQSNITNANNEIISVGNTINGNFGVDILTTKINGDGSIIWQDTFNTANSFNDYGVSVVEYANGNICVTGITDNGTTNNTNTVIIMYDANGTLLWSNIYNSSFNKNDNATAIKFDANGDIYIAVASETNYTNYDFLLLKYDASGNYQWEARYDYDSLIEIPVALEIDASNNIVITGASASTTTNWDYTMASFSNAGAFISDERLAMPGIGFDNPTSFKKDAIGNLYITGSASSNGIDYNIQTIKLNPSYAIQWAANLDFASKEDIGNSVDVDSLGNVYVGGYITGSNNRKQIILIKYDSNGNYLWRHTQASTNTTGDAFIKAIKIKNTQNIYFIGQELGSNNTQDAILCKIDSAGRINYQKKVYTTLDDKPMSLNIDNQGSVILTTLRNGSISTYQTLKYNELLLDTSMVWNVNNPEYMKHQLIVRFQPQAINTNAIDNIAGVSEIEFGGIDYFLKRWALDKFNDALAPLCSGMNGTTNNPCGIKAVKIFKGMKTNDTTMMARNGDIIPIPDFWTALLLEFPAVINIAQVHSIIDTMESVIKYSEPNRIPIPANINYCNDSSFSKQYSLVYNPIKPTYIGNINIEKAWDIVPDGGKQFVRCGIFDTGIDWKHKDWGYDGTDPNSSKIAGGWDYANQTSLKSNSQGESDLFDSHGTASSGIVGAQRNNNLFIAGIAGGNDSINSKGISLYGLHVINNGGFVGGTQLNLVCDGIKNSIMPLDSLNHFGLNIQNHSWRYDDISNIFTFGNNNLLTEAVHLSNRAQSTFVASRGNEGKDNICYPAVIDDDWVLNVGGTGRNGCYSHYDYQNDSSTINSTMSASFGHNVDIGAPADDLMIQSLKVGNAIHSFSATSAAAPHVTGVVGLLMSYLDSAGATYQNLAPEDCEKIIEISAKDDTCHIGWDKYIGAGLLDAGKALQLVEKPKKALTHFGTNSKSNSTKNFTYQIVDSNKIINMKEEYLIKPSLGPFFPSIKYKVNKYLVTATFNHVLPNNHWADTFWARPSTSNLIQDILVDTLAPRERIKIINCNSNTCIIQGYVYKIFEMNGNFKTWWPCDIDSLTKYAKIEYSVLSHAAPLNILPYKNDKFEISILPNPSSNTNKINLNLNEDYKVTISMYNIFGQKIKDILEENLIKGKYEYFNDIGTLPNGIYLYELKLNGNKQIFKILKN